MKFASVNVLPLLLGSSLVVYYNFWDIAKYLLDQFSRNMLYIDRSTVE